MSSRLRKTKNNSHQKLNVGDKKVRCDLLVAGCKADELLSEVWERPQHTGVAVKGAKLDAEVLTTDNELKC